MQLVALFSLELLEGGGVDGEQHLFAVRLGKREALGALRNIVRNAFGNIRALPPRSQDAMEIETSRHQNCNNSPAGKKLPEQLGIERHLPSSYILSLRFQFFSIASVAGPKRCWLST